MKARTLNRLIPNLDSKRMKGFERQLQDAFAEALAEEAVSAVSRFSKKAHHHSLAAAAPTPASAMVAVYPSDEEAVTLAQMGGEPAEQLHCTLAFLGELEPDQAEQAAAIVQKLATGEDGLMGSVGGVACFSDNGNGYPSIVLPDVHGLAELRHRVVEALNAGGIQHATEHGWTPHMTIAYEAEAATPPEWMMGRPLTFTHVSFAQGDRRRDFEMSGPGRIASGGLGQMPLPVVYQVELAAGSIEQEIAAVAERWQEEAVGYGETSWNAETQTVLFVAGDWTDTEPIEVDFLAIDGVEHFEYEMEALPAGWWDATVVYPENPARWVVEESLTAAGTPADWTQPHPDELIDVDALVKTFRTKADPVRLAVVETVAGQAIRGLNAEDAKAAAKLAVENASPAEIEKLLPEARLLAASQDEAASFLGKIIVGASPRSTVGVIKDAEGKLVGAVEFRELRSTKDVFIEGVASTRRGGGTALLRHAAKDAASRGVGLKLSPTEASVGFYERLGMTYDAHAGTFSYTAAETKDFAAGGEKALALSSAAFDVTNPLVRGVSGRIGQHVTSIADTTRLNVMRIVRSSYEEGLSINDTASAIREGMAAASEVRSTLIARTEMTALVNGGSLAVTRIVEGALKDAAAAAKAAGGGGGSGGGGGGGDGQVDGEESFQGFHKEWLTAPGATFPRHELDEGLDGQTVPLDSPFEVGGQLLMYPGDPDGDPAEICNCRCTLAYVDAGGNVTEQDTGTTAALAFPDELEARGGEEMGARVGKRKAEPTAETLAVDAETTELDPLGDQVEPMTAFVRIRPDMTEFRTEIEAGVREVFADVLAEVTDSRPARGPEADVVTPPERTNASQLRWEAILIPEGKITDDGRLFAPGSISWRDLPLSLMAMTVTSEGAHIGAELAGRIDRIWRDESQVPTLIRAEGIFDDNEYGNEIARLVGDQTLRGNSVDTVIREVEFGPRSDYVDDNGLWKADAPAAGAEPDEPDLAEILFGPDEDVIMVARDAVIGMSTVCPFPAFAEAGIVLAADGNEALSQPEFAIAADSTGFRWKVWMKDTVEPSEVITASAAGYAPVKPPADWFAEPDLDELTPLIVTDDGRVFGHAWAWDVCHIGIPGACTVAPRSNTDYAYFLLKEIETEDGERVACGTITLGTGHAGRSLGQEAAAEHYDNTGSAIADVVIGEDEFGGWIAGALRPDVPAARAREFRGSVLSGDWRKVEGNLELVGLLAVNVPGFPVPRAKALVASADEGNEFEVLSLVAAGVVATREKVESWTAAKLRALAARASGGLDGLATLAAYEQPLSRREALHAALTAAGEDVGAPSAPTTTFELTQGGLAERKWLSAVIEAGFAETSGGSWPSEATLEDHGEVLFRDADAGVFRISDDCIVLAAISHGWAQFRVATTSREQAADAVNAFSLAYPPLYRNTDADLNVVPITFWTLGQFGPQSRLRMIDSASWEDIEGNYSGAVREELARLMADFEPGKDGQLLLWQGSPGTGKTWALRALASEWKDWAEFAYITDPDAFFVKDPSYMIDVLLHESYESLTVEGDVVTDADPGGKWRVLILEDTGELLSANAKEAYGQGLSRLLNVVDGMVGQGLRVLALVTTNDELGDLHPAAVRPGRCASQIEFGPLSAEEASTWLGKKVEGEATLAELYEQSGKTSAAAIADDVEGEQA